MASIETFLLKKNIAKNSAHAKLIMIGVIIICLIIIVLINRPSSSSNVSEFTEEEITSFDANDLLLIPQEQQADETPAEQERRINQYDPNA